MNTAIIYTPLTIGSTGLGDPVYYNANGALSGEAVTATFNSAKTSFTIGSDVIYSARLVTFLNLTQLYSNNGYSVDFIQRSSSALTPYIAASYITNATVVDGEIVVASSGGSSKCILTGITVVDQGNYSPVGDGAADASSISVTNGNLTQVPCAGTVKNLYIIGDGTASTNNTFTIYKNGTGGATTLTVTIPNGATAGHDATHSFTVVAGDYLSVKGVVVADFAKISICLEIDPS